MPSYGFRILEEIGTLPSGGGSEIKFSIDEYRGHKYASIRKYLQRDSYTGPTKSGITMNGDVLRGVAEVLAKLPKDPKASTEQELGRFAKRPGLVLVVRITLYMNSMGIDLREWQDDVAYKGWTKRGIRLPYEHLDKIIQFLGKMKPVLK